MRAEKKVMCTAVVHMPTGQVRRAHAARSADPFADGRPGLDSNPCRLSELFTRQGHSSGLSFPRVLGIEAVGRVAKRPFGRFTSGTIVATSLAGIGREYDRGYAKTNITCYTRQSCDENGCDDRMTVWTSYLSCCISNIPYLQQPVVDSSCSFDRLMFCVETGTSIAGLRS